MDSSARANGKASLKNPFAGLHGSRQLSVKYCLWEVLREFPNGLNVTEIVRELEQRHLRDFSGRKNVPGQVSCDLIRHRDHFIHEPDQKLWFIRPLAPPGVEGHVPRKPQRGRPSKVAKLARKGQKPHGLAIVGCRVSVWWAGNCKFFDGNISSYDALNDTYDVLYDDGDRDDALQFKNFDVLFTGTNVDHVRVLETDKDEIEQAANTITQLAAAGRYSAGTGVQPSSLPPAVPLDGVLPHGALNDALVIQSAAGAARSGAVSHSDHDAANTDTGQKYEELEDAGRSSSPPHPSSSPATSLHISCLPPQPPALTDMATAAIGWADRVVNLMTAYRARQVEINDLFNSVRGHVPDPIDTNTPLGDLARRVEAVGRDSGMMAHPLEAERPGCHRLLRFCMEAFVRLAPGMDASLQEALGYADDLSNHMVARCPNSKRGAGQAILASTEPEHNDDVLQRLRLAERRLRQLVDLL